MLVQLNTNNSQSFQAHGARSFKQVMNKLYRSAYSNNLFEHEPDVFQISTRMKDGEEVTGLACFENGQYIGISFPYEHAKYRNEFCKKILNQFNNVMTKGKYKK